MSSSWCRLMAAGMVVAVASCSFGPPAVKQPRIDPARAGRLAIEMYDTNGDGVISGEELEKAPALKAALPRLDTNGDGAVSAEEIAARVRAWREMRTALVSVRCHVTLEGVPLPGATIVFEPEPFLGDAIKVATATTNAYGDAAPTIAPEDRPDPTLPGGVHFGLYKVRISKIIEGKEFIPARYNTETTLGQEVSYDDPSLEGNHLVFTLKGK